MGLEAELEDKGGLEAELEDRGGARNRAGGQGWG